jgi:ribosomal protein S18 acetylase RimI-like enzyme
MTEGPNKQEQLPIKIEIATPKDWKEWSQLRIQALSGRDKDMFGGQNARNDLTKTEEEWRHDLQREDLFYMLSRLGPEPVGIGRASKRRFNTWMIGQLYFGEKFQGQNLGKSLIEAHIKEIIKRGGKKAIAYVRSFNSRSIHIFKSLGFKKFDVIKEPADKDSGGEEKEWVGFELNLKKKE